MDYAQDAVASGFNTGGMVMDDRDTALMAIGTAFGGLQTLVLKRIINETPQTGTSVLTSPSGIAAIVVGLAFVGVGIGTRTGVIGFDKDIATLMLGYGISTIISLAINYASSSAFSTTGVPTRAFTI